ncbi:hypothetical protein FG386_001725 [Cryptosporidium ryanae]|uniref:uncharacterized protein n=1 Tax=Cryptosporidium ryanae TaxID=515981 RepID=UPI00351A4D40|nr:hypothetical protein FG386_001725 [Cryptosporidium ryanae]
MEETVKKEEPCDSEDVAFPSECIEYIMNRQGARSKNKDVFKIVGLAGQKYIEECLKKSIETSDGRFVIKNDNLRNFIRMENSNSTIWNDFNVFLMSDKRYRECDNA